MRRFVSGIHRALSAGTALNMVFGPSRRQVNNGLHRSGESQQRLGDSSDLFGKKIPVYKTRRTDSARSIKHEFGSSERRSIGKSLWFFLVVAMFAVLSASPGVEAAMDTFEEPPDGDPSAFTAPFEGSLATEPPLMKGPS